jgi:hypothetical protein
LNDCNRQSEYDYDVGNCGDEVNQFFAHTKWILMLMVASLADPKYTLGERPRKPFFHLAGAVFSLYKIPGGRG